MTSRWSWYPTWANPADAPSRNKPIESWYVSLPILPRPPTAVFASARALSELDLLREPLSAAAQTAGEHVQKLESSVAVNCSEVRPDYVEDTPQVTNVSEKGYTTPDLRMLSHEDGKTRLRDERTKNQKKGGADCSHTSGWP